MIQQLFPSFFFRTKSPHCKMILNTNKFRIPCKALICPSVHPRPTFSGISSEGYLDFGLETNNKHSTLNTYISCFKMIGLCAPSWCDTIKVAQCSAVAARCEIIEHPINFGTVLGRYCDRVPRAQSCGQRTPDKMPEL